MALKRLLVSFTISIEPTRISRTLLTVDIIAWLNSSTWKYFCTSNRLLWIVGPACETMSKLSDSHNWRNEGNSSFRRFQELTDPERQQFYLEWALKYYVKSLDAAETPDDKSSAAKNYAVASCQLALVHDKLGHSPALIDFYFRESINYFSKVYNSQHYIVSVANVTCTRGLTTAHCKVLCSFNCFCESYIANSIIVLTALIMCESG
jgi:hypothetical protein